MYECLFKFICIFMATLYFIYKVSLYPCGELAYCWPIIDAGFSYHGKGTLHSSPFASLLYNHYLLIYCFYLRSKFFESSYYRLLHSTIVFSFESSFEKNVNTFANVSFYLILLPAQLIVLYIFQPASYLQMACLLFIRRVRLS